MYFHEVCLLGLKENWSAVSQLKKMGTLCHCLCQKIPFGASLPCSFSLLLPLWWGQFCTVFSVLFFPYLTCGFCCSLTVTGLPHRPHDSFLLIIPQSRDPPPPLSFPETMILCLKGSTKQLTEHILWLLKPGATLSGMPETFTMTFSALRVSDNCTTVI